MAVARAEEVEVPVLTDYVTPEQFATFAGQIAFVVTVVQLLKLPLDGFLFGKLHIKTAYIVYCVAFGGQVLARLWQVQPGGLTWSAVPSMVLYAVIVAWGAMKAYEQIIARVEVAKLTAKAKDYVEEPDAEPPNDTVKSETA